MKTNRVAGGKTRRVKTSALFVIGVLTTKRKTLGMASQVPRFTVDALSGLANRRNGVKPINMNPPDPSPSSERCPVCGESVKVVSGDEGTSHYESVAASLLTQERQRVEELERNCDSLRLERDGLEHVRKKDNAYLVERAEAAEKRIEELEGVLEQLAEEARSPALIEEIVRAALSSEGERLKAEMERHGDDLRDLADD